MEFMGFLDFWAFPLSIIEFMDRYDKLWKVCPTEGWQLQVQKMCCLCAYYKQVQSRSLGITSSVSVFSLFHAWITPHFYPHPLLPLTLQVYHGWCEGTKNGERGMFPDNFVRMRPATEDVSSPADREQQSEKITPPVTPTEPASGESTDTGMYVCMYLSPTLTLSHIFVVRWSA